MKLAFALLLCFPLVADNPLITAFGSLSGIVKACVDGQYVASYAVLDGMTIGFSAYPAGSQISREQLLQVIATVRVGLWQKEHSK